MWNNQPRIHPLPSQLENNNNNNNNNRAPLPGRCIRIICIFTICGLICGLGYLLFIMVGSIVEDILRPTTNQTLFFHVVNASLTQFDLTNNNNSNTLDYKLTIDINVTNPNKDYIVNIDYGGKGIDYGDIEVRAYYQGILFDSVNLMPFHQDTNKNRSTSLHALFQGQDPVPRLQSDSFYRDKSDGNFDIQLQFTLIFKYHSKKILGGSFHFDNAYKKYFVVKCDLKMRDPLFNASSSSSSSSSIMNGTSSRSSSSSSSNINSPPSTGTSTTMVGAAGSFQTKECEY